jgi:predicted GNAT family acetyltransferase
MRRPLFALGIAIACAAGISCATKTELSGVWKSDSPAIRPMNQMLVIGVAENDIKRRGFEDGFAAALEEQGVNAVASYRILPNPERLSKESIQQAIRGRGIQGVLVTQLVQIDEREKYVPPRTYVSPNYYGRGLYGYYGRSYEVVHEPGYTVHTTIVRLETHLYDAASAELVWAAHSGTINPKSIDDGIGSVTKKLSKRLATDGFTPGK